MAAMQQAIRLADSTTTNLAMIFPAGGRDARRVAQNLIIVLRVSVTLLVTPAGPPLARWNAAYCS
jgi:hypothetical protein